MRVFYGDVNNNITLVRLLPLYTRYKARRTRPQNPVKRAIHQWASFFFFFYPAVSFVSIIARPRQRKTSAITERRILIL